MNDSSRRKSPEKGGPGKRSVKKKVRRPASPSRKRAKGGGARAPSSPALNEPVRLNRYIAMAGVCARRKADELIQQGRARVNGSIVREMGLRVGPGDVVEVNGQRITPLAYEYVLLNKPANTITTNSDESGRRIVLDLIDDEKIRQSGVFPVGRLDRNTVGVLLITNDGELAHRLMHPRYEVEKLYRVRTRAPVLPHQLDRLRRGVEVDGETMTLDDVVYLDPQKHDELGIRLHEGKNRQIRRMLEALGHEVAHLERVRYAGLSAAGVRRGKWRRLDSTEIRRLRRLVKLK